MSEISQPDTSISLPLDREALYHLVWQESAESIASRYKISVGFLAKRCSELRIPRPLAGYWKDFEKGKAPAIPELPVLTVHEMNRIQKAENQLTTQPVKRKHRSGSGPKPAATSASVNALIRDLKSHLPGSPVTRDGYFKPSRRKLLDIHVSDTAFERATEFLQLFFSALIKQGHQVRLAGGKEEFQRSEPDLRDNVKAPWFRWDNLWRPQTASIISMGDINIGFHLVETAEYVPAKLVKGRYIREEIHSRRTKGRYRLPFQNVSKYTLPTGRFLLEFYSPYPQTNWQLQFREKNYTSLADQIPKIVTTLHNSLPLIHQKLRESQSEAARWRAERERERQIYLKQEKSRQEHEAYAASLAELKAVMDQWAEEKRMEQFFTEAEQDAAILDSPQREHITERLALARQFLSNEPAIGLLMKWKTPAERLRTK